jgi:hypothetical protein
VKRYENYGRKVNWIVERFGKYGRKYVEYWKDMENREENCEMIWKIQTKIVKRYEKYGRK